MEQPRFSVIDGHYDIILKSGRHLRVFANGNAKKKGHIDLPRLRQGNVFAAVFAIPGMYSITLNFFLKKWLKFVQTPQNELFQIRYFEDFDQLYSNRKIGAIMSCEGAGAFDSNYKTLNSLFYQKHRLQVQLSPKLHKQLNFLSNSPIQKT